MNEFSTKSKAFIVLVVTAGVALLVAALVYRGPVTPGRLLPLLAVSILASRLRVKLPGLTGNMSVNLPFILVAVAELSTAEAMVVGCMSTLVQCLPTAGKKFNWVQTLFNFCNMALAVGATRLLYDSALLESITKSRPLLLALVTAGYFAVNSVPVAIIIWLTEGKNPLRAWVTMFQLSYPYFLAGASVAGLVIAVSAHVAWLLPLLLLPLMLGVFYSYRRYFAALLPQMDAKRAPQSVKVAQAVS